MLYRLVLVVRNGVYVEQLQRFDKGDEFLVAEVAHVEIGELLAQQIPQGAGKNPAVVVGVFFRQLDESLLDGQEILARRFFVSRYVRLGRYGCIRR